MAAAVLVFAAYAVVPPAAAKGEGAPEGSEEGLPLKAVQISAGSGHSLALLPDGTVWAWGLNDSGQLGNSQVGVGEKSHSATPVQVEGLTDVVQVAAGWGHSLAVKKDGTVWAWGSNSWGQLGNGRVGGSSATPVQVEGLTDVVQVAAGGEYSLAVKKDGTVWAWGANWHGQLGNSQVEVGWEGHSATPVQVEGLTDVVQVAVGVYHSLAVKKDGTVWAWGSNSWGQLGNSKVKVGLGYATYSVTPVQVEGLTDVVQVAAGGNHSLAVKKDGTVWAWGYNGSGELGNGQAGDYSATPVQVEGLTDVVQVAAGAYHSLALKKDGTVWAWGWNMYVQLGNSQVGMYVVDTSEPVQVEGLTDVEQVAASLSHSLALKKDGTVWAWGSNEVGQLGTRKVSVGAESYSETPVRVEGIQLSVPITPAPEEPTTPAPEEPTAPAPEERVTPPSKTELKEALKKELKEAMRQEVKGKLKAELKEKLKGELKEKLKAEIKGTLKGELKESLKQEIKEALKAELKESLKETLRKEEK
ncbi:MAG: hypothetical protein IMX03_08080 [Brockia lithotrophica]|nr:hypothetical protein [Brockia lithotrophica]